MRDQKCLQWFVFRWEKMVLSVDSIILPSLFFWWLDNDAGNCSFWFRSSHKYGNVFWSSGGAWSHLYHYDCPQTASRQHVFPLIFSCLCLKFCTMFLHGTKLEMPLTWLKASQIKLFRISSNCWSYASELITINLFILFINIYIRGLWPGMRKKNSERTKIFSFITHFERKGESFRT